LQRTGDFSELGNRIFDPLSGAAFPGNRIPVSRFNNISQQVASFYPAPTASGTANNFVENVTQPSNQQSFDVKSDFQVTSKLVMFARESFSQRDLTTPPTGDFHFAGGSTANSRNQNAVVGITYTLSPNKISETRSGSTGSR